MLKKLLMIYTGGTIGMNYTTSGVLQVVKGLFKSCIAKLSYTNAIDVIEYDKTIDSSDIDISYWQQIIQSIADNYHNYDGFIVIHGTDTMAYTASILAFALENLTKPVILTGAQLPLIHERSDGWVNIIDAMYAANLDGFCEVAIVFNHKLLRGSRTQKISTSHFVGFDSIDELPLAEFGVNVEVFKDRWIKPKNISFNPIKLKNSNILNISLRPGFTTEFIANTLLSTDISAVILQTYGSGNIPINNKHLMHGIHHAISRGVIIVNITQVLYGKVLTEYINGGNTFGLISGLDITVEAILAKLLVLLSKDIDICTIKQLIGENLVGELKTSRSAM